VLRQRNFRQNFSRKFPENFTTKVWIFLTKFSRESFVKISPEISRKCYITCTELNILLLNSLSWWNSKYPIVLSKFRLKVNFAQCSIYNFSRFLFVGTAVGRRQRNFPKFAESFGPKFWQNFMSSEFKKKHNTSYN